MIEVINKVDKIDSLYNNGTFDIERWKKYIYEIIKSQNNIFIDDMNEVLLTGNYSYEKDFLSVINNVIIRDDLRRKTIDSFEKVTNDLEKKIINIFGKSIDVKIVLYLGLCNGAGWAVDIDDVQYVFLGIEKIIELNWCDVDNMKGLIFHELGHIYQNQYGILTIQYNTDYDRFIWQLFTEGIAMVFEQLIVGNLNYFHQDNNGWLNWCQSNINQIITDFNNDLKVMSFNNQRYFGDWLKYKEHSDVGYFLGARFVQWLKKKYLFDEIINFNLDKVKNEWNKFLLYKLETS